MKAISLHYTPYRYNIWLLNPINHNTVPMPLGVTPTNAPGVGVFATWLHCPVVGS